MSLVNGVFKEDESRFVYPGDIRREFQVFICNIMGALTFTSLRMETTSAQVAFRTLYMVDAITFEEHDFFYKEFKFAYVHRYEQLKSLQLALGGLSYDS